MEGDYCHLGANISPSLYPNFAVEVLLELWLKPCSQILIWKSVFSVHLGFLNFKFDKVARNAQNKMPADFN